jgi:coatomer protein complex subunit gamma
MNSPPITVADSLDLFHACQVIRQSSASEDNGGRPFYDFLENCLRHKSEMVIFEAARCVLYLSEISYCVYVSVKNSVWQGDH